LSATLETTLTDEQLQAIGENAAENFLSHNGWQKLKELGVDFNHMLSVDDQNLAMLYAECIMDYRICMTMFGKAEPTEPMKASRFVSALHGALRVTGKEALRRDIDAKTKGAKVVSFVNSRGGRLVIHPAVRPDAESDWQLTTIGCDGRPWGHVNPPTFQEALYRALGISEDGYWNESGYSYEWSDNVGGHPPI
jgi:hypothetical protein